MPNIIYTEFDRQRSLGAINWTTAVVRIMLERSTSAYTPNVDHSFVSNLTGFVEVTVANYARQTATGKTVIKDDANNRTILDLDDINFGNLESGQTAKGILLFVQTGGNDNTPGDDVLVAYFDTMSSLPAVFGGGAFTIQIDANGLIQTSQA